MSVKVSPYPIPELKEFLRPFRQHFYRAESLHTLERYATGLLADVERKSGAGIARAIAFGTNRVYNGAPIELTEEPYAANTCSHDHGAFLGPGRSQE